MQEIYGDKKILTFGNKIFLTIMKRVCTKYRPPAASRKWASSLNNVFHLDTIDITEKYLPFSFECVDYPVL